jgi:hypothetical protein
MTGGPPATACANPAMVATAATQPRLVRGDAAVLRLRRAVGETAAVLQVGLGTLVVLAAAERHSVLSSTNHGAFTAWFAGPLRGLLPSTPVGAARLHSDLRFVLAAMLGLWLLVLLGGRTLRTAPVIAAVVALHAVFLLSPPLMLTDLFNYLGYARLDVVHHLNPYVTLPLAQKGDPVYAYSNWHRLLSPYGPLFTLMMLPIAKLSLPVAYWVYKVALTVASLGFMAGVWACARRLGRPPAAAVAFVALNPVVLVYALGGKHNDLLMMACVMAGCLLVLRRQEALGGGALAAAVAIKASAGVLLPVILLGAPRRWRTLAGLAAGAVIAGTLTLLAFGAHLPDLRDQDQLVNPFSFPNLLGYALGHGGADSAIRRAMAVVLVAGVGVCTAVAWRRRTWVTPAGWAALAGVVTVSWLMPWYIVWALPFAALSRSRTLRVVLVVVTAWVLCVSSGLAPLVARQHGFKPGATPLARANRQYMESLLTNPPARRAPTAPATGVSSR